MWLVMGVFAFGFLLGTLIGFSATPVVGTALPLLFTFMGGAAVAGLPRLSDEARATVGTAMLSLGAACVLGLYLSIFVNEHHLLTPAPLRPTTEQQDRRTYLRNADVDNIAAIDQQVRNGFLTFQQAYERLRVEILQ
jgi:hypothetical protein